MPIKDPEKLKEYQHQWYVENKKRILKERKDKYDSQTKEERHPEKRKAYFRKRYKRI